MTILVLKRTLVLKIRYNNDGNTIVMSNVKTAIKHLTIALAALQDGEATSAGLEFPTVKAIKAMDAEGYAEVIEQFGLTAKPKAHASILTTIANVLADKEVDDDDLAAAVAAAGLEEDSDADALKEFIAAAGSSEPDEDEAPKKGKKAAASDDDDEDADEAPKSRKKSADADEDEDDEDADEAPAKAKKGKKAAEADEESEDEEDEEAITEEIEGKLEEYNEAVEKSDRVKKPAQLVARCTDDDGKVVKWGQAYIKDGEAYCCGVSLAEDESFKGDGAQGTCIVTGKTWHIDTEDNTFTEVKKKGSSKSGAKKPVADDEDDD